MPRTRVRSSRRETARSIAFVVGLVLLMTLLLVGGTVILDRFLREDVARSIPSQVTDPSAPLTREQLVDIDYVALGDSYSAGPGLPPVADAPCRRSGANYPALLAERLEVASFVDVTCLGARTLDIIRPQPLSGGAAAPPQYDALTEDVDLVTLSIGGNDEAVFNTIVTQCPVIAAEEPEGNPCQLELAGEGDDMLNQQEERIRSRISSIIRTIRQRSPEAQVVVVGYPSIFPTRGTCPALPFAPGDVPWAASVVDAIVDGMRAAAEDVGVRFADLRVASDGHDVCSPTPWMTGAVTPSAGVYPWHPVERGMSGAADFIYRQLTGA